MFVELKTNAGHEHATINSETHRLQISGFGTFSNDDTLAYATGQVVDVEDDYADELIGRGLAVATEMSEAQFSEAELSREREAGEVWVARVRGEKQFHGGYEDAGNG